MERVVTPVRSLRPSKIICVGLNYRTHIDETRMEVPRYPLLFAKWPNAIIGDSEPIILPPAATQVDYEAELAVIIGRRGRSLIPDEAPGVVAGYTCLNDVSARDVQFADGQWKSFDTFCPIGPRLVPKEVVTTLSGSVSAVFSTEMSSRTTRPPT